jgi:drug/metabolite transporter (DMT)-like permease
VDNIIIMVVLSAAFLHAWWNFLVRSNTDKILAMIAMTIGHAPLAILGIIYFGLPGRESLPFLIASAVLHVGYQVFLMNAYRFGELSNIYPIARGLSPLILSIVTLYIGQDMLTTGQMVGIATISLSMIYMGFTQFRINKDGPKGLLLACITGIFIASYSMVDALGTRLTGDAMMYFSSSTILNVLLMAIYSMMFHKPALMSIISNGKKPFFIGGTASYLAYVMVLWACLHAPVAIVSSLRETSVIFAMILGVFLLGEQISRTKIIVTLIMITGVIITRIY